MTTRPPRRHVVVLNAAAGTLAGLDHGEVASRARAAFETAGQRARVVVSGPERMDEDMAAAIADREADTVVVGGGDGTISRAARRIVGTRKALGVLPLGTLNLFARDLGIPLDLDGALAALAGGTVRLVDVGSVGEHVFLSNATLGIYPRMVAAREAERRATGAGKWPAMARAAWRVLRRPRPLVLDYVHEGRRERVRTPVFMVANNRIADIAGPYLVRECVDGGELALYIARPRNALGILRLAMAAIAGRVNDNPDLVARGGAREIAVTGPRPAYPVALDGEVVDLAPPMIFRIWPRSLAVLAPAAGEAGSAGAADASGAGAGRGARAAPGATRNVSRVIVPGGPAVSMLPPTCFAKARMSESPRPA